MELDDISARLYEAICNLYYVKFPSDMAIKKDDMYFIQYTIAFPVQKF
jgi:hypothetical protein